MPEARAAHLTSDDLQRLSQDPRNKVFSAEPEATHEPWDPDEIEQLLRVLHQAFVAHCMARADAALEEDEEAAVAIVKSAGARAVTMAQQHPALVGKATTRTSALDPKQMSMIWRMLQLRKAVHQGSATVEDAQRQLVSETLPSFLTPRRA